MDNRNAFNSYTEALKVPIRPYDLSKTQS